MQRQFDPAELEMMDRPQPVSAELERDLSNLQQLNNLKDRIDQLQTQLNAPAAINTLSVAGIPAKTIKVKTIAPESVKAAAEKK